MKIADGWVEIVETFADCPYCFQNVVFRDLFHKQGEELICPECLNKFQLGEPA